MGIYAFPHLVLDLCELTVKPVLATVLETVFREEKTDLGSYLQEEVGQETLDQLAHSLRLEKKLGPRELSLSELFILLFGQAYTGYERDPDKNGALALLMDGYQLSDQDLDRLWMCQYIYQSSDAETMDAQNQPSDSTWADERALDLVQEALRPYGEGVEKLLEPYERSLEVQMDMRRAAAGDSDAMLEVTYHLMEGYGVEKDLVEAQKWAEAAYAGNSMRKEEARILAEFLDLWNQRQN